MASIGTFGQKLDLNIRQGASFAFSLTINNPDGTPADLTGVAAGAMLRKKYADASPVLVFDVAMVLPNSLRFSLDHVQTSAIAAGEKPTDAASLYVWDCEITWSNGDVTSPVYGDVRVKAEATK